MAYQYVVSVAREFGLIGAFMGDSVLLVNPDAEGERSYDPEPSLEQDAPTAEPEPILHQGEQINKVGHCRTYEVCRGQNRRTVVGL